MADPFRSSEPDGAREEAKAGRTEIPKPLCLCAFVRDFSFFRVSPAAELEWVLSQRHKGTKKEWGKSALLARPNER